MKKLAIVPFLLMLMSCHGNSTSGTDQQKTDSANDKKVTAGSATIKAPRHPDSLTTNQSNSPATAKNILGIWWALGDNDPNAAFEINKDSVYYPEQFKSYKYTLKGDTIRIKYDDFEQSFAFNFKSKDTLMLKSDGEETMYHRKK